jgi:hypothetical protein
VHVNQDQGHPLPFRQLVQRCPDVQPDVNAAVVVAGVSHGAQVGVGQMHHGLDPSEPVQAGVDHDSVKPCRDSGVAPEGAGASEGGDEGFLYGVSGHFRVPSGTQGKGPHLISMAPKDLTESIWISGAVRGEQLTVGKLTHVIQARHHAALS